MKIPVDMSKNGIKGSSLLKAGFENGIFALPIDVKNRIDQLLKFNYSPIKVLKVASQEFPNITLPSKSALYIYKKKYLDSSNVSIPGQAQVENLDIEKVKVKSLLMDHVKRFLAVDLIKLRENWLTSIERDRTVGLDMKETRDKEKSYLDALKLCTDLVPKLNINIDLSEKNKLEEEPISKNDLSEKLARILEKRQIQFRVKQGFS